MSAGGAVAAACLVAMSMLVCSGCAAIGSQVVRTGPIASSKPVDAPIAVFFNTSPPWSWTEVGRIRVESTAGLDEVMGETLADALKLGADAVIIDLRYHYRSLPVTFDERGMPHVPDTPRLNANAIAVVYRTGAGPP